MLFAESITVVSVGSTGREGEVSSLNSTQPWLSREEEDLGGGTVCTVETRGLHQSKDKVR